MSRILQLWKATWAAEADGRDRVHLVLLSGMLWLLLGAQLAVVAYLFLQK